MIQGPEFVYWGSKKPKTIRINHENLYPSGEPNEARVNLSRPKYVRIESANGKLFDIVCRNSNKLQELFDVIVQQLGVVEHFYFGLAWINDREEYFFVDLRNTLQVREQNAFLNTRCEIIPFAGSCAGRLDFGQDAVIQTVVSGQVLRHRRERDQKRDDTRAAVLADQTRHFGRSSGLLRSGFHSVRGHRPPD